MALKCEMQQLRAFVAEADISRQVALARPIVAQGADLELLTALFAQEQQRNMGLVQAASTAGVDEKAMGHWMVQMGRVLILMKEQNHPVQNWADLRTRAAQLPAAQADEALRVISIGEQQGFATPGAFAERMRGGAIFFSSTPSSWTPIGAFISAVREGVREAIEWVRLIGWSIGKILSMIAEFAMDLLQAVLSCLRVFFAAIGEIIVWLCDQTKEIFLAAYNYLAMTAGEILKAIYDKLPTKAKEQLHKFLEQLHNCYLEAKKLGEQLRDAVVAAAEWGSQAIKDIEEWFRRHKEDINKAVDALISAGKAVCVILLAIVSSGPWTFAYIGAAAAYAAGSGEMEYKKWQVLSDIPRLKRVDGANKYVVFSDLHRGGRLEKQNRIEKAHLNQRAYVEALKYYWNNGYTIIENGDAEDLWNLVLLVRDIRGDFNSLSDTSRREIVQGIVAEHKETYEWLKKFHQAGRYIKVRGNHDADIRDPVVREVLSNALGANASKPLEIHDAVLVERAKSLLHMAGKLGFPRPMVELPSAFGKVLKTIPIPGWGSARPKKKRPNEQPAPAPAINGVLVLHGHQVDFWNAEEHDYLGRAVTAVSVREQLASAATDEALRPLLQLILPSLTKEEWLHHLSEDDFKKYQNTYGPGGGIGVGAPWLTEVPMSQLARKLKVGVVMGHTHEAKVFMQSNETHVFANSGTGGMWEGVVFCTEIADGRVTVNTWSDPLRLSGTEKQRLETVFEESQAIV